jgi:energy-coupling factor transporter ATP-binding protein EcfA2
MSEIPLKNRIINWLKDNKYWVQFAGNRILEGENISDELVNETYSKLKQELGLEEIQENEEITFNEIAISKKNLESKLSLTKIKDIENVNALAKGQSITLSENLTIIYGGNGTGKSGYIRLLNNAFSSRGDKNILPNVFEEETNGIPKSTFTFISDKGEYDIQYPEGENHSEFTRFTVFDSQSVKVHLEKDNKLNFTPKGFDFFEKLLKLYELLSDKLKNEIQSKRKTNEFNRYFVNENHIQSEVLKIGSETDIESLKKTANFTKEESDELTRLISKKEQLKSLNIPKKTKELQKIQTQLSEHISRQQNILNFLSESEIAKLKALNSSYIKLRSLVRKEGVQSLSDYEIEELGSDEWRDFIKASRSYSNKLNAKREQSEFYPNEKDNCIYCLQPLTDKENTLINSYWKLLKSETQAKQSRVNQEIKEIEKEIRELFLIKFDETTNLYNYVSKSFPELADKWKKIAEDSLKSLKNLETNLSNRYEEKVVKSFTENTNEFSKISDKLKKEIESLFKKDSSKELKELDAKISLLNDKSLLYKLQDKIIEYIKDLKWADSAQKQLSVLNTRAVTTKQGELFSLYITDKYTKTFNEECTKLNAPKVVNIVQKNAKASTLRKLQVAGQLANAVLSEGEQRAISIADFLTEVRLNPNNKGIFFDDPITSQDHDRREKIASRLVELAKEKQITVFTHDIAFFIRLKIMAESRGVEHLYTTIRKAGGTPGIINEELPWIVQPVARRIKFLRNRLVRLKKIEKEESEDTYLLELKSWYGLLREAWERTVEERLFKGVVERFSLGIQSQKLKKIVISDDLIAEINKGMTESSSWLHDSAAGLNPTVPETTKAESDLDELASFAKKCVAA